MGVPNLFEELQKSSNPCGNIDQSLSRKSDPMDFKTQEGCQRRLDRLPSTIPHLIDQPLQSVYGKPSVEPEWWG